MNKKKAPKKKPYSVLLFLSKHFAILLILIFAFIIRLYKINSPLSDHHSWRQADTSAVTRNFVKYGIDLLHPKYDDLSPIQSGKENPQGYRMVEFPIYNAMSAKLYTFLLKSVSVEVSGRIISVLFSLLLIYSVYILMKSMYSTIAGLASAFFLSFFPFSLFYSRTILPDMTSISLTFISLVLNYMGHLKKNNFKKTILISFSLALFALALLVKPTVIFYSIVFIAILHNMYDLGYFKKISFYAFFLSYVPFIMWRLWILRYPEGIPASEWLFTSVNTSNGLEKIFFKPAFFRWIFIERIQNLILGGLSIFFVILGTFNIKKKLIPIAIGISALLYLLTFQGGNVQHDYYQIIILPAIGVFFGIGVHALLVDRKNALFSLIFRLIISAFLILLSLFYSWYLTRHFFDENKFLQNIAQIIKTVTPSESLIVTDTTGDTTLLYLAERKGYPAPVLSWDLLKQKGMNYFVTMNKQVGEALKNENTLKTVFESDAIYIFKL